VLATDRRVERENRLEVGIEFIDGQRSTLGEIGLALL
jgi:hypothetical protein